MESPIVLNGSPEKRFEPKNGYLIVRGDNEWRCPAAFPLKNMHMELTGAFDGSVYEKDVGIDRIDCITKRKLAGEQWRWWGSTKYFPLLTQRI